MDDEITLDGLAAHLHALADQQDTACVTGVPTPEVVRANVLAEAYRHSAGLVEQALWNAGGDRGAS